MKKLNFLTFSDLCSKCEPFDQALKSGDVSTKNPYGWRFDKSNWSIMCDDAGYMIEADLLTGEDWVSHLMEKKWFDLNKFIPVYFYALRKSGAESVSMKVYGVGYQFLDLKNVGDD